MILNVNTYANVILERSFRAIEGHISVNEIIYIDYNETNLDTNEWILSVHEQLKQYNS